MAKRCECSDPGCPCCQGHCERRSAVTLYRVDMQDESGTRFCENCANDAYESGVFADTHPDDRDGDDIDLEGELTEEDHRGLDDGPTLDLDDPRITPPGWQSL